jgi:hypothetical protein
MNATPPHHLLCCAACMQWCMPWQPEGGALERCVRGCCSVELRLRFPGTDLWSGHKALQSEVSLMFLLLGAVYVHHLPQLLAQLGIDPVLLDTSTPVHILATMAVLTLPGAAAAATDGLMRLVAGELLPMVAGGVVLCCNVLCCTMLCCAVLCCAVLCCAVLAAQSCGVSCPILLCCIAERVMV